MDTDYYVGTVSKWYGAVAPISDKGVAVAICPLYSSTLPAATTVFKLDSIGNFVWAISIDDLYQRINIVEDDDGNILLSGTDSTRYSYILKLSSNGNLIWSKKCLQPSYGEAIIAYDSCYYLLGHTYYPLSGTVTERKCLTKFDSNGNQIWSKLYSTIHFGYVSNAILNNNGQITLVGTVSHGNQAFGPHLMTIDTAGTIIWSKAYDYNEFCAPFSLIQMANGNFVITGEFDTPVNVFVAITDSIGNHIQSKTYTNGILAVGTGLAEKSDGGIYVTGVVRSGVAPFNYESVILELNATGDLIDAVQFDLGSSGSFLLDSYKDETGIVALGYKWTEQTMWINHNGPDLDFPCQQKPITLSSQTLPQNQIDVVHTTYDSVIFVNHIFTITPVTFNIFQTCYETLVLPEPEDSINTPEVINLTIPNVFSPNNDDVNDEFTIDYFGDQTFNLQILNRWGFIVFQTNTPDIKWNGKLNNISDEVTDGVYFYHLSIADYTWHGAVTLVR